MSLSADIRRISRACSRQLNLAETMQARVQIEFWVGTAKA